MGFLSVPIDSMAYANKTKRPKIALVLCGGGAKGAAHVGVLKVLEESGIKPDMIVGTSIGGIVGGLYALGYDAQKLDTIIRGLDWDYLLSDNTLRKDAAFKQKLLDETFSFQIPFYSIKAPQQDSIKSSGIKQKEQMQSSSSLLPGGLRSGQNVMNIMAGLCGGYLDSIDFNNLPIPFACIATDLVSGEEVILNKGLLPLSMRSTMAIPGFFAPVPMGDKVLVDGGMVNNFPVDVAREMGADIVIGVDIQNDLATAKDLKSISQVLNQIMGLMGNERYLKNVKNTNIYIKPNVDGFTTFSFDSKSVDSLIVNGYIAASEKRGELEQLAKKLKKYPPQKISKAPLATEVVKDKFFISDIEMKGVGEKDAKWLLRQTNIARGSTITGEDINKAISIFFGTKAFSSVTYQLIPDSLKYRDKLVFEFKKGPTNIVGLGVRFDTEEMAAILVYLGYRTYSLNGVRASLSGRLSYNPYGKLDFSYIFRKFPKLNFSYKFQSSDMNIYQRSSSNHLKFYYNNVDFSFSNRYLRNFDFQLGARIESFNFTQFLTNNTNISDFSLKAKSYLSYYLNAVMDNRDSKTFPTRGVSINAESSYYQTNFTNDFSNFLAVKFDLLSAVSVSNNITFLPSLYTRTLIGQMNEYAYLNFAGGTQPGRYMNQQIPFIGINYANVFKNSIAVLGLDLRGKIAKNHYIYAMSSLLRNGENFVYMFNKNGQGFIGLGVKYAYATPLGPLSINLHWSNYSKNRVGCYVNFGYYF